VDADNGVAQATVTPPVTVRKIPAAAFAPFYRDHFRTLLRIAMYAGATLHEAEDATQEAMAEVMRRWYDIVDPLAYAKRAVVTNFIRARTRGMDRTRRRQVERGDGTPAVGEDSGLTLWEDRQWVSQLLDSLPPEQGRVMRFVVEGFTPAQIGAVLGRSSDAVRQSLYAARKRLLLTLETERAAEHGAGSMRKEA
jgi:RNA polymerase sigma factor (sigma-70 family)